MSLGPSKILSSKWTGLNPSLLASLYPCDARGRQVDGPLVVAPLTEGTIELTANWQSPFEQSGADSKAPAITAMAQLGTLQSYAETFLGKGSDTGALARLRQQLTEVSEAAQGRTGATKLNTTQVFTGSAPVKIPVTLIFRAFDNPAAEVTAPLDQLARWTLPRQLAPDGALVSAVQALRDGQGLLKALLPSVAPQMVALRHGGYTFAPLVIESMSRPIQVPRASDGQPLHVAVQLMLASLTAMDADDWTRAANGLPIQLFNDR